jgi:hypothetical protein
MAEDHEEKACQEEEEEEDLDDSAYQMSVASDTSILASELGKPPALVV